MSSSHATDADVMDAAMALPADKRLDLAVALWYSVNGAGDIHGTEEDRQATLAMLRERIRQIDSGEVEPVPHAEVMRQVREHIRPA